VCSSLIITAQTSEWVTVKAEAEGYKIDFPEQPIEQSQNVPSEIGDLTMKFFMLDNSSNSNAENIIYMSAYTQYPEDFVIDTSEAFTTSVLDGVVKGAVANVRGELISDTKVVFKEYPGRKIKIEIQGGMVINAQAILVGNLLYIYQTISKKENDDNAKMKTFFNSFDFIETKK